MAIAIMKPLTAPATGRCFPIGATLVPGGDNFSVFSRSAASIELLLFDRPDDARPSRVIPIDPLGNRIGRPGWRTAGAQNHAQLSSVGTSGAYLRIGCLAGGHQQRRKY